MFLSLNDVKVAIQGMGNMSDWIRQPNASADALDGTIHPTPRFGGAYRDRTDDLLNANQALSQLS